MLLIKTLNSYQKDINMFFYFIKVIWTNLFLAPNLFAVHHWLVFHKRISRWYLHEQESDWWVERQIICFAYLESKKIKPRNGNVLPIEKVGERQNLFNIKVFITIIINLTVCHKRCDWALKINHMTASRDV